ncbi:MAG TPA: histidine utilization repressor [Stellaceae bacterium]|nr:histidine utilization repressor [Stellaceae bacterium]
MAGNAVKRLARAASERRPGAAVPKPLYQQVKDFVIAEIAAGALAPGARLPSEQELVRALGVSRMTANRALRELYAQGVLTRVPGVGTFVAAPRSEGELLEVRNIAAEIRERGGRYSSIVHQLAEIAATAAVAEALGLSEGAPVFRSVIVHCENGAPLQLEDRFVNPAAAPGYLGADFSRRTPNEYLSDFIPISEVEHVVEAILPDRRTQKLLGVPAQEPCLRLYRVTTSFGRKVTCVWLTHPGSKYRMVARFTPGRLRGVPRGGD